MLVQTLLRGQLLVVRIDGRSFSTALADLPKLLIDVLREVYDPKQLPLTRWLADRFVIGREMAWPLLRALCSRPRSARHPCRRE